MKKKVTKRRKNPVVENFDNIRRWTYLNFPKHEKDPIDIVYSYSNYFNIPFDHAYTTLQPYIRLWIYIQEQKWTKNEKLKIWRKYLIDEPELFKSFKQT